MRRTLVTTLLSVFFLWSFISIGIVHNSSESRSENEREGGRNEAREALDFWTRARAYPNADIPADKYFQAYQLSKMKHNSLPTILTAGSVWDPLGPTNLHGRSLCAAVNPLNSNTIYLGTASGGLWRSYSDGLKADWQQVKLGYPALGISSIVIDPTDSNSIYVGTGEVYGYETSDGGLVLRTTRGSYGIGILKTTDGGTTWTKSLDWSYNQQRGIEKLLMNPLNRHTIWAAASEGLYRSQDDGSTWNLIKPTLLGEDIIINPLDTNQMIVSFGDLNSAGTGIYKSTNGGGAWTIIGGLPSYTGKALLSCCTSSPNIVYASIATDSVSGAGSLRRSTDFGATWNLISDNTTLPLYEVQGWYSHYVIVHPTDPGQIIYNGVERSKSDDGGASFHFIATGYSDNHGYAVDPNNPNIVYVANDDGIYRSTDFGDSYTDVGTGLQTGQFYNGFACSSTDSLIALGQSQDHIPGYRYLGGPVWDHNSANDEAGWTAINPSNDNIMYAVARFGSSILRSTDRGASFSTVKVLNSTGAWNSPIVVANSNPNVLYMGDVQIHKSTNSGGVWVTMNGGNMLDFNPVLSMAVSATDANIVYAGTAPISGPPHIFKTINGGTVWTGITGTLPNRYPIDLCVDPQNSQKVYLAMGGFDSGHFFKTTDGGNNWTDISGTLPNVPGTAVTVDPLDSNVVYAGNDLGVYVSTDGGSSWSNFSEGLPDAIIVADLTISPSNHALRVATHGNGVWERKLLHQLPANYFDYKVASIDYPPIGTFDTVGTSFSPIKATFRNLSAQSASDSFTVKFRILRDNTEIYSSTRRIAGLGFIQSRQVTFDSSFTPPDTAVYMLEAISLAADQNSSDDTLRQSLTILSKPTVKYWQITKHYALYDEISGGDAGPAGDDFESRAAIPFKFKYDGYLYDSVQMSTNGWLELGTGEQGSFRGLSTDGQIGAYFTSTQANTGRPTKVLGPWWADMNTTGAGQITYTTLGIAPDRIFVVQWQNIRAYFDQASTTTYLNFQVRLYETTNIVEYCYGPATIGTYPAGASGASIVLKDYVGGDYRYYDLIRKSSGLVGDLRSNLSPITDWPGQDSVFRIETNAHATGVASTQHPIPSSFALRQNYPNPFNPTTTIAFDIPTRGMVSLIVYNLLGQEVEHLVNREYAPGSYTVQADFSSLASGMYLYKLQAGSFSQVKKMVLVR